MQNDKWRMVKCGKCKTEFDYLKHAEGDFTEIDGTIHTRCPNCGKPRKIAQ